MDQETFCLVLHDLDAMKNWPLFAPLPGRLNARFQSVCQ